MNSFFSKNWLYNRSFDLTFILAPSFLSVIFVLMLLCHLRGLLKFHQGVLGIC